MVAAGADGHNGEAARGAPPAAPISVSGSGAAASGGGVAAGAGGIAVGRDVYGGIQQTVYEDDWAYRTEGLPNPYLGLRSFTYAERALFAGREAIIADALARLTEPGAPRTLLFITGASGSGKSSLALAGLVPALEQHYAARHLTSRHAVCRPGRQPLPRLADALGQLGLPIQDGGATLQAAIGTPDAFAHIVQAHTPHGHINLLVLDQFEELFTQADPDQRQLLCALLAGLPAFAELRMHLIATLRADYLPDLFASRALYDIAKQGIDLRAMSVAQLTAAIQQPLQVQAGQDARYHGKCWEVALVERLAHDAAPDAAYLPLLQVTLEMLWARGRLQLSAYGTLTDAIKQRAEAVYGYENAEGQQHLRPPTEQAAILALLLALVDVSLDDETQRDVPRRRRRVDLEDGSAERRHLIDELVSARLLSVMVETEGETPTEYVDIIHESLIRNWDRLQQAITQRRRDLRMRVQFEQAVAEWCDHGQADAYLLQGVRLAEARELARRGDIALRDPHAHELLERSNAAAKAQEQRELAQAQALAEEQARAAARLRRWARALAGAVLVALVFASVAIWAQQRAQHQTEVAQSALTRQLAAQVANHLDDQPDLALLLGVEATHMRSNTEAKDSLVMGVDHTPCLDTVLRGSFERVNSVAFNPNGKTLAAGSGDQTIQLWDVATHQRLGAPFSSHSGAVQSVAFSPHGQTLAVATKDGAIRVWNVQDPWHAYLLGPPLSSHNGAVPSVAFSPHGQTLAVATKDGMIQLWDVARWQLLAQFPTGPMGQVANLAFSPDGRWLAAGSITGTIRLWDVATGRRHGAPRRSHSGAVQGIAFSPDGKTLATGTRGGTIQLWDVAALQPLGAPIHGEAGPVDSVAFSPNGKTLASGGEYHTIQLWNVQDPRHAQRIDPPLAGHTGSVLSVAFNPRDGDVLASSSFDHTIRLWDAACRPIAARAGDVTSVAFSRDGVLASGNAAGTVQLWSVDDSQAIGAPLSSHSDAVQSVAFSPDGKTLATGTKGGTIQLWKVRKVRDQWRAYPLGAPLSGHTGAVQSVAFSSHGETLAAGTTDGATQLWDVARRQLLRHLATGQVGSVYSVAFSPDGYTLASSGCAQGEDRECMAGVIQLWDVRDLRHAHSLRVLPTSHMDVVYSVAFSPNGHTLASGDFDGMVRLWDVRHPRHAHALHAPFIGHTNRVMSVAFSPDGTTLASASFDHTIRLWDLSTGSSVPLTGHMGWVYSVAFSPPDGHTLASTLASGSTDHTIRFWDFDNVAGLQDRACHIANRNLTRQEWSEYLGDRPYRKTCRTLPVP